MHIIISKCIFYTCIFLFNLMIARNKLLLFVSAGCLVLAHEEKVGDTNATVEHLSDVCVVFCTGLSVEGIHL